MRKKLDDYFWFYFLIGVMAAAVIHLILLIPWPAHAEDGFTGDKKYAGECLDEIEISDPAISRDLLKAICWLESNWSQFKGGQPYRTKKGGTKYSSWGIAQLNDDPASRYPGIDYKLIKFNLRENLKGSLVILSDKFSQVKRIRKSKRISKRHSDTEIALRLYNGWNPRTGGKWDYARAVIDILEAKPWEFRKLK